MNGDPIRPSDLLRGILREAGATASRSKIQTAVARAAGPNRRDSVSVRSFRGGRLVLEVASAPLFAELRGFGAESLRQRINQELDGSAVSHIAFRMAGSGHA